jgi:6-phosphogluconolactonase
MWGKMSPLFKLRHKNMTTIVYQHAKAIIQEGEIVKDLGEGKITELELIGPTHSFLLKRDTQNPGKIFTSIKSQESCSVPASFNTDDLNIGHSLMRQLQYDQTNQIQVDALEQIAQAPFKNVFSFPNLEETLHELKNKLLYIARDAIKQNNVFRIALSGGKTPMSLYRSFKREDLDWSKMLIFFSDERQVSPDDNDSNYKNAMDALQHLQLDPKNIFRIQAESNQDANCYTYDRLIRPYLDVCLLGMGADGHTLSIFPNSPVLQESNRLVVPAPGPNHARVTFTFEALKICKHKIFLITGEEKKQMLETILQQMDPQHPASLVTDVDIYTDIKL